jgi:hypothetical protein
MGRKKSKFDTRPKASVSSEPEQLEYYTDADGNVRVRRHSRDGGQVQVKEHARRKGLRARLDVKSKLKPEQKPPESSPSKDFMNNLDSRSRDVDEMLKEREENY